MSLLDDMTTRMDRGMQSKCATWIFRTTRTQFIEAAIVQAGI